MAKDKVQIKLLKILEILYRFSDEDSPLSAYDIIDKLQEADLTCDRRTIGKDIEILKESGYEIFKEFKAHKYYYYIVDRPFDVAELRILIDAVQSANFITNKKTEELTRKIAELAGQHRAELLKRNVLYNSIKHSNENIFYNTDSIDEAICQRRKITFRYFDFGSDGKRQYRKNGKKYEVNPVCTMIDDNQYYLLCYSDTHTDRIGHYRIDRMTDVERTEDQITPSVEVERMDLSMYRKELIDMFGG